MPRLQPCGENRRLMENLYYLLMPNSRLQLLIFHGYAIVLLPYMEYLLLRKWIVTSWDIEAGLMLK